MLNRLLSSLTLLLLFVPIPSHAKSVEEQLKSLGVGMWIWHPDRAASDALSLANLAVAHQLGHVYLKSNDGSQWFRSYDQIACNAQALTAQGVKVFAWGYTHASFPAEEAAIVISMLDTPDIIGYVFDAEGGVESYDKWDEVEQMLTTIRLHQRSCDKCSTKLLGFAPHALPSRHSRLPYKVFAEFTDFIEPQIYWGTMGCSVESCLSRIYRDWLAWEQENGINKPIIPLGQAYNPARPLKSGDIAAFGQQTRGYYAVAFWDWEHATPGMWEEIHQVAAARATSPVSTPPDFGNPSLFQDQRLESTDARTTRGYFWQQWWHTWNSRYQNGVIFILLMGLWSIPLLLQDRRKRLVAATGVTLGAFSWHYLLAGALISLTLAALVAMGYGIYKAAMFTRSLQLSR